MPTPFNEPSISPPPDAPVRHTVPLTQLAAFLDDQHDLRTKLWEQYRIVHALNVTCETPLVLESGQVLPSYRQVMECYGTLNEQRDNAVLVCHALTGDAHLAGRHTLHDPKPGWWDGIVGPGRALDASKHFIVCIHALGGCNGSTGPQDVHPDTLQPYHTDFPAITIGDMVEAQRQIQMALHIPQWHTVMGGSMGGFKALEWGLRFPDAMRHLVLLATGPRYSTQGIAFNSVGRHAILHDPQFHDGHYAAHGCIPRRGLATARMLAHITYVSENSLEQKFGRNVIKQQDGLVSRHARASHVASGQFTPAYEVESYLDYQGRQFVERFDANSYLYLSKVLDDYDAAQAWGNGDLKQAFKRIQAYCCFIAYDTDWLFPPRETSDMVQALVQNNKQCRHVTLESPHGHDAFLIDVERLNTLLAPMLDISTPCAENASPPKPYTLHPLRDDLVPLLALVNPGDQTILDLGCGRGELLYALKQRGIKAWGIEQTTEAVCFGLEQNLSILHGDIETLLRDMPDNSADVAILHLALQSLHHPLAVLQQMKRVARRCIIGFPNFGFTPIRLQLLLNGRMPNSKALPFMWYDTPNIHLFTLKDFDVLLTELGLKQHRRYYRLGTEWILREAPIWGCNFRASHAIYELY
jgi:homoserine O-acetyltransferase/O-succinyltransferase